jgi:hypothetical protein
MFENFFSYPKDMPKILDHINGVYLENDLYFCPHLFETQRRKKEYVSSCPNLWSDLDTCSPENLKVAPTVTIESSPSRYQGLWALERPVDPEEAEDYSRRIAYAHSDDGSDRSGWDLTQLLRVPLTYNYKYEPAATVTINDANSKRYRLADFADYPQAEGFEYLEVPFPSADELEPFEAKDILTEKRSVLNPRSFTLFYEEPESDWSKALWQLELMLFESGLDRLEVFAIATEAACNKYRRDQRDPRLLWKEVCKAEQHTTEMTRESVGDKELTISDKLLTDEERQKVADNPTIIEEYVEWAKGLGDAAWQYHQVSAFTILSSLLAGSVRLPTSYGTLVPNLWFLILADTTLTRKTTAMDIAMDMILEIDPDAVLATDGSIEGLFTSLSTRPGRASIFLRDEFSGLIEMMTKKDYYAGMAETLTKMYDGKFQKRVLRREVIEVRDPVLILFAGGIRTRIYELLRYEHVASGFVPRFVFVSADSDITRLRPLGPPTDGTVEKRQELTARFKDLYNHFHRTQEMKIDGRVTLTQVRWTAKLTPEAWARYNRLEADMLAVGLDSDKADIMTPTMDRLAKSGLKMSVLLAATREDEGDIKVTEADVLHAFSYIEQWGQFTLDLIYNIGKGASERELDRVLRNIRRIPGISRSVLMQNHHLNARNATLIHLNARNATLIFETLEQRGLVRKEKKGRGELYYAY